MGDPSGQIGAVGFFQLRLPNDEVFGLMRRKLGLLRAGVENNDADDEGEYVAEFAIAECFPFIGRNLPKILKYSI